MDRTELNADAIRDGREAAGWSIAQAARELRRRAPGELPDLDSVVRSWKRWEAGTRPSRTYGVLLARLFGASDATRVHMASNPSVWRRWLAFELRRLRDERHQSQLETNRACGWSAARLSYIENAQQNVTLDDLEHLLVLYEVPVDRWVTYHEAAERARDMGWWQRNDQCEVPNWLSLFVGLEQGASDLRTYQPVVMPGLLQTPDYAAAVLDRDPVPRTEAHVARLVALRIARQDAVTRTSDPLQLRVILDESVLHRPTGSDHVMSDQVHHLATMAEQPNVEVQVLPLGAGVHSAAFGAFVILGFPWEGDPGLVYVENRSGAVYLESTHEIDAHSLVFQQLSVLALNTKESAVLLRKAAKGVHS